MSVRKRNEFLEGGESDEEADNGYESDSNELSRGNIPNKRRRLEAASDDESINAVEEGEVFELDAAQANGNGILDSADEGENVVEEDVSPKPQKAFLKPSTPKQVAAAQKAARRSGVIYISRVPPFMKPQTLKHFLAPHAPKGIGRIFLTPEDHAAHTRRVKSGGNKKKSFTDGWVEFVSKRDAKIAADILNGNIIGGKKRNFYHDDLWSMKYLKGFKWSHLTEQIANENAERAARMREEVRKTRQENRAFVEDVERGKMLESMETKRKAKRVMNGLPGNSQDATSNRRGKEFKQKSIQRSHNGEHISDQASRMQRLIF